MSYNYDIYAERITRRISHITEQDLKWLCNTCASVYKAIDDGCVDNFRCCAGNTMSEEYKEAQNNGCCGSWDEVFMNPMTKREFMVGFNYGH